MNLYNILHPWIPEPYSGYVWPAYFSAAAIAGARFSVVRYKGTLRGSGVGGSFDVIERAGWLGAHFAERMLENDFTAAPMPSCSVYGIAERMRRSDADIAMSVVGRYLSPRVFGDKCLRMPGWIGHAVASPSDAAARRAILMKLDDDVRRTKRRKFRYELDRSPDGIARFHRDFYVPTIAQRHGEAAWTFSPALFQREAPHSAMMWVLSGDEKIAGTFFQISPPKVRARASGVAGGDAELFRLGAMASCYVFLFQVAHELGCDVIDYGGTRPSQNDGVFRYKQKWRAELYDSPITSTEEIGVHWSRPSAAVDTFIRGYAPVFRCTGGLAAVDTGVHRIPFGISMIAPPENRGDTAEFLRSLRPYDRSQTANIK